MMLSFGAAREFPGAPSFTSLVLKQPIQVHAEAIRMIFIRLFNYSARFAPPGKTVVQVEFETDWTIGMSCKPRTDQRTRPRRNASQPRS